MPKTPAKKPAEMNEAFESIFDSAAAHAPVRRRPKLHFLPCPFCGETPEVREHIDGDFLSLECACTRADERYIDFTFGSVSDALAFGNRRAPLPEKPAKSAKEA